MGVDIHSGPAPARTRAPNTPLERRWRLGGTQGNEILTSAAATVLIGLLVAEGITIVHMHGLLSAHMFIGLVLIPPVLLKLGSTGSLRSAGALRVVTPCPVRARGRCSSPPRSEVAQLSR